MLIISKSQLYSQINISCQRFLRCNWLILSPYTKITSFINYLDCENLLLNLFICQYNRVIKETYLIFSYMTHFQLYFSVFIIAKDFKKFLWFTISREKKLFNMSIKLIHIIPQVFIQIICFLFTLTSVKQKLYSLGFVPIYVEWLLHYRHCQIVLLILKL